LDDSDAVSALHATVREVGKLIRLRISLPDRPGALGEVATIIAGHGGNITSVDVQFADAESAVDDLVVEFSMDPDLLQLRDDLATHGAATVMSHQEAYSADPIVATLRRLVEVVDAGRADASAALADGVAELCSSPVVWISSAEEAAYYEAGRFAIEHKAAVTIRKTQLPEHLAERLHGEVWLLAVFDPQGLAQGRVVFVARSIGNPFTATEIGRIEVLAALHSGIDRIMSGPVEDGFRPSGGR
jgi:ACT domain